MLIIQIAIINIRSLSLWLKILNAKIRYLTLVACILCQLLYYTSYEQLMLIHTFTDLKGKSRCVTTLIIVTVIIITITTMRYAVKEPKINLKQLNQWSLTYLMLKQMFS